MDFKRVIGRIKEQNELAVGKDHLIRFPLKVFQHVREIPGCADIFKTGTET